MPNMDEVLTATPLADLVEQSNYRETVMLVALVIVAVGYILDRVVRLVRSRSPEKDTAVDNEIEEARIASIRVITTKDTDGNYIFLSIPRHMRDLVEEMREIGKSMTHLVNHQSEIITKLNKRLDRVDRK